MPAVSITPAVSFSNTEQSSNRDGTPTDTVIDAADLASAQDHLILYSAAYAAKSRSHQCGARLSYGSTIIGYSADGAALSRGNTVRGCGQLSGFYVLTGDGTSDLSIDHVRTQGPAYVVSTGLVSIPLADLTLNTDYFFSQQNGDAAEVTVATGYTSLLEATFTLPERGEYLVLLSAEGWTPSGATTEAEGFRFIINGEQLRPDGGKVWKTNNAVRSFAYAGLHLLPVNDNTFRIDVGSFQGSLSKSFRRGRIIVLKATSLEQTLSARFTGPQTVQAVDPTFDTLVSQTYAPFKQDYTLTISNTLAHHGQSGQGVIQRIRNTTDASNWNARNGDSTENSVVDRTLLTSFACEQIDGPKNYALQASGDTSGSTWQTGELVSLSLTVVFPRDIILPDSDGSAQGAWAIVGGSTTRADTVDTADIDTTYVWLDGAIVGDFFDLKLDTIYGKVAPSATDPAELSFRGRALSDQQECEITVDLYEGDPAVSGALIDSVVHTLSESVFEEALASFTWATFRDSITDWDDLYVRVRVSNITGTGGAPQPAISLVQLVLPGEISKNVDTHSIHPATVGQVYTVYDQTGRRHRKVTFDETENWKDRNGNPVESLTPRVVKIIAYGILET